MWNHGLPIQKETYFGLWFHLIMSELYYPIWLLIHCGKCRQMDHHFPSQEDHCNWIIMLVATSLQLLSMSWRASATYRSILHLYVHSYIMFHISSLVELKIKIIRKKEVCYWIYIILIVNWVCLYPQEICLKNQEEIIQTFQDTIEDPSCDGILFSN